MCIWLMSGKVSMSPPMTNSFSTPAPFPELGLYIVCGLSDQVHRMYSGIQQAVPCLSGHEITTCVSWGRDKWTRSKHNILSGTTRLLFPRLRYLHDCYFLHSQCNYMQIQVHYNVRTDMLERNAGYTLMVTIIWSSALGDQQFRVSLFDTDIVHARPRVAVWCRSAVPVGGAGRRRCRKCI